MNNETRMAVVRAHEAVQEALIVAQLESDRFPASRVEAFLMAASTAFEMILRERGDQDGEPCAPGLEPG